MSIGQMSAEQDQKFLAECFIETGQPEQVCDIDNPSAIVLGRTGSGKSALLFHIDETQDNVSRIDPEDLSLNFISNSTIIRYFEDLGVDLNVFYQLLWRHVLVVELLKLKKEFYDQESAKKWFAGIYNTLNRNPKRQAALEYLTRFSSQFWLDTEKRVKEVVSKIESSMEDKIGMTADALRAKIEAASVASDKRSREETAEIINKAQQVVNAVQIQELSELLSFLAEDIFDDKKARYYLIIDDLDTGWVHDSLRFKLIRALIETLRKFRRVSNVKIVISLRADLLHTVMTRTEGRGFQSEKFEDMMLRLRWSADDLKDLIEERLNFVFKDQYTGRRVKFEDIFTSKIGDHEPLTYMLNRSLYRPRDVISYVNQCFEEAEPGASSISARLVRQAEAEYSNKRFRAIVEEWEGAFGDLETVLESLRHLDARFAYTDLTDKFFENICIELVAGDGVVSGKFVSICNGIINNEQPNYHHLRRTFVEVMYLVGAVGIKRSSGSKFEWSYKNDPVLNTALVDSDTKFAIHPMLHRRLNLKGDGSTFNT
ncbi:hypothetical protein N0B51_08840 [Tsuneonella sp. YG55]|uniref:KAP family P-loop domain protein n=1 Tax=Tsuneonella litorea TaxID=2976475 RepID=A0A9X2W1J9_9SPHN|nr:hypothetical protein [Tsuneonella litorea]MCT2559086.1 hypothetical protein [Tsuneonella litorea]